MNGSPRIVRFLRECYEADNRETALFDLRRDKVQHFRVLNQGGEFLTGALDLIPVEHLSALEAQKTARLYEAEKTLVFGAFLLVGCLRHAAPPTPKKIFAPLIFFPAVVEENHAQAFLRVAPREQLPGESLLRRYLESIVRPSAERPRAAPADAFLREVQETLSQAG